MSSPTAMKIADMEVLHRLLGAPYSYLGCVIVLVVVSAFYLSRRNDKSSIPFYVGEGDPKVRWMTDALNLLKEGYHKFGARPFQVWTTEGKQVILPPKFVDEVKMLPDDKFKSSLLDIMQGQHTTFCSPDREFIVAKIVKHELNKNMSKLFPLMNEEVKLALPAELPTCNDWTPVTFYPMMTRVVSQVAGRAFVGAPLNRNEQWIKTSIGYTRDVFEAAAQLRRWHPLLRPIMKNRVPPIWRIYKDNSITEQLLTPIIKELEQQAKNGNKVTRNDAITWVRNALSPAEKQDYAFQAINALGYGAASIHTTSQLATNSIFDLVARPQYIEMLREEAREILTESGGEWKLEDMAKLKKMDSFMREAQRHKGSSVASFQRQVVKPITLSDGTLLKPGTMLFTPSQAISWDPTIYENPEEFDGLRYYNLRQRSAADEKRHQLVSTSKNEMHFGGGRHACPGRWFVSHEIKLILATLLLNYDMKLKEGEGRPESILYQWQYVPDQTVQILFKKVGI